VYLLFCLEREKKEIKQKKKKAIFYPRSTPKESEIGDRSVGKEKGHHRRYCIEALIYLNHPHVLTAVHFSGPLSSGLPCGISGL
jgi:hypothetical protein